jgi:hypothetical protein
MLQKDRVAECSHVAGVDHDDAQKESHPMTTKLNSAFKRELDVNGDKYTLTVSPEGFKLVQKGKRKGVELQWTAILNGDAALATALNASTIGASKRSMSSMGRYPTKH